VIRLTWALVWSDGEVLAVGTDADYERALVRNGGGPWVRSDRSRSLYGFALGQRANARPTEAYAWYSEEDRRMIKHSRRPEHFFRPMRIAGPDASVAERAAMRVQQYPNSVQGDK
jgi:hypothetical protein